MVILGLCGGSGSGKNRVQEAFAALSVPGLDTDRVYHDLTNHPSPLCDALGARFGREVLAEDGSLNRRALAKKIFSSPEEEQRALLLALNNITHPHVIEVCMSWLEEERRRGTEIALLNVPLLLESSLAECCDVKVAVLAPYETRVSRILKRDGVTRAEAEARIARQASNEFLVANTDFQILNDRGINTLRDRVQSLYNTIKERYGG